VDDSKTTSGRQRERVTGVSHFINRVDLWAEMNITATEAIRGGASVVGVCAAAGNLWNIRTGESLFG
jgi:hypothetical protein